MTNLTKKKRVNATNKSDIKKKTMKVDKTLIELREQAKKILLKTPIGQEVAQVEAVAEALKMKCHQMTKIKLLLIWDQCLLIGIVSNFLFA